MVVLYDLFRVRGDLCRRTGYRTTPALDIPTLNFEFDTANMVQVM